MRTWLFFTVRERTRARGVPRHCSTRTRMRAVDTSFREGCAAPTHRAVYLPRFQIRSTHLSMPPLTRAPGPIGSERQSRASPLSPRLTFASATLQRHPAPCCDFVVILNTFDGVLIRMARLGKAHGGGPFLAMCAIE